MFRIYRYEEGVTVNNKNYVLNRNLEPMEFFTEEDAKSHLAMYDIKEPELYGIHIEEGEHV